MGSAALARSHSADSLLPARGDRESEGRRRDGPGLTFSLSLPLRPLPPFVFLSLLRRLQPRVTLLSGESSQVLASERQSQHSSMSK